MINNILFDTNIFYDLSLPENNDIYNQIKNNSQKLIKSYSVISLLEILSHICDKELIINNQINNNKYTKYFKTLNVLNSITNNMLGNPEEFVCTNMGIPYSKKHPEDNYFEELLKYILTCNTYEKLKQTNIAYWDNKLSKVKYKSEYAHKFRAQYEDDFVNEMFKITITYVPNAVKKLVKGKSIKITDKKLRGQLENFLDTNFKTQFIESMIKYKISDYKIYLIGKKGNFNFFYSKLEAFFITYRNLIKKVFLEGLGFLPKKDYFNEETNIHKNYHNDLNLMIYLCNDKTCFITNDKKLLDLIETEKLVYQKNRILSLNDFLKLL